MLDLSFGVLNIILGIMMKKLTSLPLSEPDDKAQVSALSGHPCDITDDINDNPFDIRYDNI